MNRMSRIPNGLIGIVRHAEAGKNRDQIKTHGRIGEEDKERLTDRGLTEAIHLGLFTVQCLARCHLDNNGLRIALGDYPRYTYTAELLAPAIQNAARFVLGHTLEPVIEPPDRYLSGINMGPLNNKSYDQIAREAPDIHGQLARWMSGASDRPPDMPTPNGETADEYALRIYLGVVDKLLHPEATKIFIVGSSGVSAMSRAMSLIAKNGIQPVGRFQLGRYPYVHSEPGSVAMYRVSADSIDQLTPGFVDPSHWTFPTP